MYHPCRRKNDEERKDSLVCFRMNREAAVLTSMAMLCLVVITVKTEFCGENTRDELGMQ
jgi:hypothetical protein